MKTARQLELLCTVLRYGLFRLGDLRARLSDPAEAERLRRKHAAGEITHVRCLVPFTRIEFVGRGLVTTCCQAFTHVPSVGNMKRGTIEEIWNGRTLQRVRRRMLLGEIEKVCRPNCPFLRQAPVEIGKINADSEHGRALKEDLEAGRTELSAWPVRFTLSNWGACNLHCVMCGNYTHAAMPAHVAKDAGEFKALF